MSDEKQRRIDSDEDPSVTVFRDYLRIKSVQPNPDYDGTVKFLEHLADEIGLAFLKVEVSPEKPMLIMTWEGSDPSLPSLMLHSHMDVVPVFAEHWKVDPFSADKMENGDIYARGSQDMKCVSIQYLEAIRRMKLDGKKCLRTIHLTFSSDEEIGSKPMSLFVEHKEFKKLNVGFALDEGLASPGEVFRVFYGERSVWWIKVICKGSPGHASGFIKNTAAEKLQTVINRFLQFRCEEEKRLKNDASLEHGDVTTVNLTMLQGGVQFNVVPAELSVGFDLRIPPHANVEEFEQTLKTWCKEAGEDVSYEFVVKGIHQETSSIDKNDPWWAAFSSVSENLGLKLKTEIFPAGTDSRFTRKNGIPALGFSPMNQTPVLLHDHNEYLNEKIFLRGIDIYYHIIQGLANVPK